MRLIRPVRVRPPWFERKLIFERVESRFDPLPDAAERAEAGLFVFAVGTQQSAAERSHVSGAFAGASSKPTGRPSGAQSR